MKVGRFAREQDDNFSTICNRIMKEKTISLKAKGLYALVMSLPPTWDFSVQGIVAISKEESGAIYTAIKELIKEGYCQRNMISEKGRFIGCEYKFFNKKRKPQEEEPHNEKPHRDFPHTENDEDNKVFNESNSSSSDTTPTDLNKEKRLSNDNQKVVYSEDFISFWSLYNNGSKQQAYKEWNKLKAGEKQRAMDNVTDYLNFCKYIGRKRKDTSTYLHQKGFDEDWLATPEPYVVQDTDDEKVAKFKTYMVLQHKELIFHRNPLTYEQAHECSEKYLPEQVLWALNMLKQRDIHQYFSIAKGIEAVIADDPLFDEMEKEDEQ